MHILKCVLIGDPGVGKSALVQRFTKQSFRDRWYPTVFDTNSQYVMMDGILTVISMWEVSCLPEHRESRDKFAYLDANACLFCFAMNDLDSLKALVKWKEEVQNMKIILVGLKSDLQIETPYMAIKNVQAEVGAVKFCACSSKKNADVSFIFDTLIRSCKCDTFNWF